MNDNNRRLARNSMIMYVQVFLGMIIGFVTARVLLKTLGASDYGTYNVVGGFVSAMYIISGPMVSGLQRFFAFDIGKNDEDQLSKDFNTTNLIYLFFGIIIILLLETIGLWFINNKMSFEEGRMDVVNWVYQFSVFAFVLSVIAQPYNALILAHENIFINSVFTIIEKVGNLMIVLSLSLVPYDHLIVYSSLMFILAVIMRLAPQIYCKRRYRESRFFLFWDKSFFKSLFSYSAFNTIGVFAGVAQVQGLNVLLNIFFGPVVNAARALSSQLQNIVQSFYINIFTPSRPQITKYYAREEYDEMWTLYIRVSKIMFFVCMVISVPLFLEVDYVLKIWLGEYPELTPAFLRLSLIIALFSSSSILNCAVLQAANKIKREQVFSALIQVMVLPISYVSLKKGAGPLCPLIIAVVLQFIAIIIDALVVRYELKKNMIFYYKMLFRLYSTCAISLIVSYLVMTMIPSSFLRVVLVTMTSILISTATMYVIGLDVQERMMFIKLMRNASKRLRCTLKRTL